MPLTTCVTERDEDEAQREEGRTSSANARARLAWRQVRVEVGRLTRFVSEGTLRSCGTIDSEETEVRLPLLSKMESSIAEVYQPVLSMIESHDVRLTSGRRTVHAVKHLVAQVWRGRGAL